jgi:hypothetical protein
MSHFYFIGVAGWLGPEAANPTPKTAAVTISGLRTRAIGVSLSKLIFAHGETVSQPRKFMHRGFAKK